MTHHKNGAKRTIVNTTKGFQNTLKVSIMIRTSHLEYIQNNLSNLMKTVFIAINNSTSVLQFVKH